MRYLVLILGFLAPSAAFAHYGDHSEFDLAALAAHLFETDHIIFAGIAVATGIIAYQAGRKAEARAATRKAKTDQSGPRP